MTAETPSAAAPADLARSRAEITRPPGQHRPGERADRVPPARAAADLAVIRLVSQARNGDKRAWDALVERYSPLIWSICRRYRLSGADADDVGQSVWLRLVDHLGNLRDPAALPGWLATTTRRECGRVLRTTRGPNAVGYVPDDRVLPDERAATADEELLEAERHAALREAFATLPPSGQQLIAMLTADPPVAYAEISSRLGIPVGSIGPTRRRCLEKLRRHPAIAALITADSSAAADRDMAATALQSRQRPPTTGAMSIRPAREAQPDGAPG
jgi:RNA polymerase sigma factor (sigma-70 family)